MTQEFDRRGPLATTDILPVSEANAVPDPWDGEDTNSLHAHDFDSTLPHLPAPFADGDDVPAAPDAATHQSTVPRHFPCIQGYQITGLIAKGGMGCVYAARDLNFDREVAIKTLLNRENAQRFITESKITARLPHPGIPPVHAMGTLDDGSPYLAMKLVHGKTFAEMLHARSSTQQELPRFVQIFEQMAQAVGFAHSRSVIHRDLKPLNVMVGEFGEVQVMDWGLAKELTSAGHEFVDSGPINDDFSQTHAGSIMGTPGYMAPEQARGEAVDARADVFALGSILVAILTGKPAFTGSTPREAIATSAAANLTDVFGRLEQCEADGELLAVAKRCLAASPEDRPIDARQVAAEIAAYRAGVDARLKQAETERAASLVREAEGRKRRRVAVTLSSAIAVVLLAGLAVSLWQMDRAITAEGLAKTNEAKAKSERDLKDEQRQRAERNEKQAETERDRAQKERANAVAVRDFLRYQLVSRASVWEQSSIAVAATKNSPSARHDITVRELLELAGKEFSPQTIESRFPNQPDVQAEILETIGEAFDDTGDSDKAVQFLEAAVVLRERSLGPAQPATIVSQCRLALVYLSADRLSSAISLGVKLLGHMEANLTNEQPFDSGDPNSDLVTQVLKLVERHIDGHRHELPTYTSLSLADTAAILLQLPRLQRVADLAQERYGPGDRRTIYVRLVLAGFYMSAGQLQVAVASYEQLLATAERSPSRDDKLLFRLREILLLAYEEQGRSPREIVKLAQVNYEEADRLFGAEHPTTLASLTQFASLCSDSERFEQAVQLLTRALQLSRAKLGPDHPNTLRCLGDLAWNYRECDDFEQALALDEEALNLTKARFGPDHRDTLVAMHALAMSFQAAGQHPRAIELLEKVRDVEVNKLGPEHPDLLTAINDLADAYRLAGKLTQAVERYVQLRDARVKQLGAEHPDTLATLHNLARAYQDGGNLPQAIELFEQVRHARVRVLGSEHDHTLDTLCCLAQAFKASGKLLQAIELFEQVRDVEVRVLGAEHLSTLTTCHSLAGAYKVAGKLSQAIELYEQVREARMKKLGAEHSDTLLTINNLAAIYFRADRLRQAIELYEQVRAAQIKTLGPEDSTTLTTAHNLAMAYYVGGKLPQAIELFEQVRDARVRKLGAEHADTLNSLAMLAKSCHAAGKLSDAIALYEQAAIEIEKQEYRHPAAGPIVGDLIRAYEADRQFAKAEAWRRKWMEVVKQQAGAGSPAYAGELAFLGMSLLAQEKYPEAEQVFRECLAIRETTEPDVWTTFSTISQLGGALVGQKKYTDAEPLLLAGYEGMKQREEKIPDAGRVRLIESLKRLVDLYKAWEKPTEAARWQAALDAAQPKPAQS